MTNRRRKIFRSAAMTTSFIAVFTSIGVESELFYTLYQSAEVKTSSQRGVQLAPTKNDRQVQAHELKSNKRVIAFHKTGQHLVTLSVLNVFPMSYLGPQKDYTRKELMEHSQALIDEQNSMFIHSEVNVRVKLVGTVFETQSFSTKEKGSNVLSDYDDPKKFLEAHRMRKQTNADIVMIMAETHGGSDCGVAKGNNLGLSAHNAVAVVKPSCSKSESDHVYEHELGHNLGLQHDRGEIRHEKHSKEADEMTDTGYGYVDPSGKVRDIMAYDTTCKNGGCLEAPVYSNPNLASPLDVKGKDGKVAAVMTPLGDAHNDAAGYMNRHLVEYAAFDFNGGN